MGEGELDIDEFIERRRSQESFGIVRDPLTGFSVSFPHFPKSGEPSCTMSQTRLKRELRRAKKISEPKKPQVVENESAETPLVKKPEPQVVQNKSVENPVVKVDYFKDYEQGRTICEWKIKLAMGMDWSIPQDIKNWAKETVKLGDNARAFLDRTNPGKMPPELSLVIAGSGHDNRCTWCHSFWTAFKNRSNDESFKIHKSEGCIFEK